MYKIYIKYGGRPKNCVLIYKHTDKLTYKHTDKITYKDKDKQNYKPAPEQS